MKYISTRDPSHAVSFHDALFQGLAPDAGLFIPERLPFLDQDTIAHAYEDSLAELGMRIMSLFTTELPTQDLQQIITDALSFPIPLVYLEDNLYLLEVFHGPTMAFKDVGARFMARALSYFLTHENKHLNIIVATSGDTGSAIANAFHLMPNIDVYVLYPSQKITFLQEQQMTTLGDNIHALEIKGTFDDCQFLVKTALMDQEIRKHGLITTANSINIARLLPQMIYHAFGICQLQKYHPHKAPILSVPSGNFGNLTSAIYANQVGFPIASFIAATNINDIVPQYLKTGIFKPQPSQHSLSNAMDVGNPSNFERLQACINNGFDINKVTGISITDQETLDEIKNTYTRTQYILDPHTAVGVASARLMQNNDIPIIVTATAHPAKFPEVIKQALGMEIGVPVQLQAALNGKKQATMLEPNIDAFKKLLLL